MDGTVMGLDLLLDWTLTSLKFIVNVNCMLILFTDNPVWMHRIYGVIEFIRWATRREFTPFLWQGIL